MNSWVPGTTPIFPDTVSTITAAISSPCSSNTLLTSSISLYLQTRVFFTTSAGTPGLVGTPKVNVPEPDWTNNPSECPW